MLPTALEQPLDVDLHQLWFELEQSLQGLSDYQQLEVAGDAIARIAEVVYSRAQQILDELERAQGAFDRESQAEVCLSRELLEPFIRQSVSLNLESVLAPPTTRQREPGIQSLVGECTKEALLQVLDEEQVQHETLAIAHVEAVEEWTAMLREFLEDTSQPILLADLLEQLPLAWVEVWMALLLGGFSLKQQGEFYDLNSIVVS
jgi:hypothetical protein